MAEALSERNRAVGRPNDSLFSLAFHCGQNGEREDRGWREKENNSDVEHKRNRKASRERKQRKHMIKEEVKKNW